MLKMALEKQGFDIRIEGLHLILSKKFLILGTKRGFETQMGMMGPGYEPGTSENVTFQS